MPHIAAAAATATKTETKQLGARQKMGRTGDNENGLQQNHKLMEANVSFNNINFVHYDTETYSTSNLCSKQGEWVKKHC